MQGGEGTREEMCFAFLNYYPYLAEDLVKCGSIPTPDSFVPFVVNDIPQVMVHASYCMTGLLVVHFHARSNVLLTSVKVRAHTHFAGG